MRSERATSCAKSPAECYGAGKSHVSQSKRKQYQNERRFERKVTKWFDEAPESLKRSKVPTYIRGWTWGWLDESSIRRNTGGKDTIGWDQSQPTGNAYRALGIFPIPWKTSSILRVQSIFKSWSWFRQVLSRAKSCPVFATAESSFAREYRLHPAQQRFRLETGFLFTPLASSQVGDDVPSLRMPLGFWIEKSYTHPYLKGFLTRIPGPHAYAGTSLDAQPQYPREFRQSCTVATMLLMQQMCINVAARSTTI
ncbi:hypothetical protein DFH08DRAFT_821630 [Mycena albidolilacea]|uniref:Uncharacterized protein n=1 Tax=Mycena albidolilacea TaxID=1033008 RepID=A0AAD6ZAN7_9AGAR|nr:hypothetical protein DFH08DRAFT_821630 [Mycena albidolilacea]